MNQDEFNAVVEEFRSAVDATGSPLAMKSLLISSDTGIFSHVFDPFTDLTDLRSISKVAVSLAVGIGIAEGVEVRGEPLGLTTRVWPFFADRVSPDSVPDIDRWKQVNVRHLLTNTMGHREGFLFRKDIGDRDPFALLDYVFSARLEYEPGSHFSYSNVGPYLVSALVQNELAVSLAEWVESMLFARLGISRFSWAKYGEYTAGCTGLALGYEDLHKLGRLLVDNGAWDNRQVVPSEWIQGMRSPQVLSPEKYDAKRVFPKYAYGVSLWVTKEGNYYCDGTNGQYLIVIPRRRLVITTLGNQADMKPITRCLRGLL